VREYKYTATFEVYEAALRDYVTKVVTENGELDWFLKQAELERVATEADGETFDPIEHMLDYLIVSSPAFDADARQGFRFTGSVMEECALGTLPGTLSGTSSKK